MHVGTPTVIGEVRGERVWSGIVKRPVDPGSSLWLSLQNLAGDGQAGFLDATDPLQARFYGLEGLDVSSNGRYLYVADGDRGEGKSYHRVRRIDLGP